METLKDDPDWVVGFPSVWQLSIYGDRNVFLSKSVVCSTLINELPRVWRCYAG